MEFQYRRERRLAAVSVAARALLFRIPRPLRIRFCQSWTEFATELRRRASCCAQSLAQDLELRQPPRNRHRHVCEPMGMKRAGIRVGASADVGCPVEAVYDFVVVKFFENYPRWSPEVIELDRLDAGGIGIGTRGRQVRVDRGRRSETTFRVTELEPPWHVRFEGERDARFAIRFDFEPCDVHASNLGIEFELKRVELYMRPFEKLIRRAIRDGAERTLRNIKGLVENEA